MLTLTANNTHTSCLYKLCTAGVSTFILFSFTLPHEHTACVRVTVGILSLQFISAHELFLSLLLSSNHFFPKSLHLTHSFPLPLIHPSLLRRSSVLPPLPFSPQQESHAFHGTCAEAQMSALAATGK